VADASMSSDSLAFAVEILQEDTSTAVDQFSFAGNTVHADQSTGTDEFLGYVDFPPVADSAFASDSAAGDQVAVDDFEILSTSFSVASQPTFAYVIVEVTMAEVSGGGTFADLSAGRTLIAVSSGRTFVEVEQ
jgi:hypothetical protein